MVANQNQGNGCDPLQTTTSRRETTHKNLTRPAGKPLPQIGQSGLPISKRATLYKCRHLRRRAVNAVHAEKRITCGKLRKQFLAGAMWI